jgi:hypothetical protein
MRTVLALSSTKLDALHRVDPIGVVLEIGDDRHDFIGPCRDIDAGAGLIRHEP